MQNVATINRTCRNHRVVALAKSTSGNRPKMSHEAKREAKITTVMLGAYTVSEWVLVGHPGWPSRRLPQANRHAVNASRRANGSAVGVSGCALCEPPRPEPSCGGRTAEQLRPCRGFALKDRARGDHRADLPASATGEAQEAAGSGLYGQFRAGWARS
jgi:hypothetical protein